MFKKSLSSLALAGLLITGVSVSQASADTPYVSAANLAVSGGYFETASSDKTSAVITDNVAILNASTRWDFTEAFLVANAGETLSYTVTVKDPSNNSIQNSFLNSSTTARFSKGQSGYLQGAGNWVSEDMALGTLTIPQDPTGMFGSYNAYVDVYAANYRSGGTLPDGTYTIEFNLFANGDNVNEASGVTQRNLMATFDVKNSTVVVPESTTFANFSTVACINTSKVAVGDEVTAELYLNDSLASNSSNYWETQSTFKSPSENGYRSSDVATSVTITDYDVANGLTARSSGTIANPTAGDEYDVQVKLFNTSTNEDVSGDCAPAKPSAPMAMYMMQSLNVSGTLSAGSERNNGVCYLYDKASPLVAISTSYMNVQWGSSNYSCSIVGLVSGKTYVVKVATQYQGKLSPLSDPSSDIIVPAGGYTFTTPYAGVVAAGKVVKASDNILPLEDLSSYPKVLDDGKGGVYTFGASFGCVGMVCGTTQARIRHMTAGALDSTFAGTGSVVLTSFSPTNAFVNTMGYYGTNKDKWVVAATGYDSNLTDQKVQFIFGNSANATTTSKDVTKDQLNQACDAGASGYTMRPSYSPSLSIVSNGTANPFVSITCYKQYTLPGNTAAWLSLGVLATVDPATGALSVKGSLGTPSASANGFVSRYSINPSATGNEPSITVFVASHLYTVYNDMNNTGTGTVADHSIIRFKSDGTILSTTDSAWGTSGGPSSSDIFPSIASINSGKIYATQRAGLSTNLLTVGTTGAATVKAMDTSASTIMGASFGIPGAYAIPSDETLIPLAAIGMGELAAAWVNPTTGVVTMGEKLAYASTPGNGSTQSWVYGSDKNTYLLVSASTAPNNLTVLKWIDTRYTVPTGPVPAVTSKNLKYSKNTPAAGTKVTLTGTNLNAVTSATIGGNAATLGTKSATSLQLTVPTASSAGTVDIVLATADGATTVDTFTYVGTGVEQSVEVADLAAEVTLGAVDLALSATVSFSPNDAGTQGAVTWSSDTPTVCSIVSNKVRFLAGGTCTVKATAAASGLLLAGSDTETLTVLPRAQTITLSGPTNPEVDLDGIDLTATTTSGLAITFATTTSGVCSVDSTGHVTPITAGECVVTATQAGNASWLSDSKQVTVVFVAPATTPIVDNGNPAKPSILAKTGAWVKNGDTQLSWNRTKGTLAFKVSIVYIGPIKGTAVFKVGSKSYTCVVNFGTLKKQATAKRLVLTSPNLCSGAKEKAQLAALKKVPANTVVKITIVRDMKAPTTYAKYRTKTRVIYAKLG